jgi:hypothetical protein
VQTLATRPQSQAESFSAFGLTSAQLGEIEAVSAHHANNYMPLVAKHRRRDRATMFAFTSVVELEATSADRSVLDAVDRGRARAPDPRFHPRPSRRRPG